MGRLDEVVLFDPLGPRAAGAHRRPAAVRAGGPGRAARATRCAIPPRRRPRWPATRPRAYGARELRRKVGRAVEQALADRIASGDAGPGAAFHRGCRPGRSDRAGQRRHGRLRVNPARPAKQAIRQNARRSAGLAPAGRGHFCGWANGGTGALPGLPGGSRLRLFRPGAQHRQRPVRPRKEHAGQKQHQRVGREQKRLVLHK